MATALAVSDQASPVVELALVPAARPPLTLYNLEEQLLCLADTMEMVPADQEQEFLEQFQRSLTAAVEKRDRVGQFLAHLEAQSAFAVEEIKRLQERKDFFDRAQERIEKYVIAAIQSLGRDAKQKWLKLEGNSVTFQIKKCPPSVEVTDQEAVPEQYKSVTITLPFGLYDELLDTLDMDFAGKIEDAVSKARIDVSKTAVKAALQGEQSVPGAKLVDDKYRLERK